MNEQENERIENNTTNEQLSEIISDTMLEINKKRIAFCEMISYLQVMLNEIDYRYMQVIRQLEVKFKALEGK